MSAIKRARKEPTVCSNAEPPQSDDAKRQKEMNLPGRQANPRRLQLWQTLGTNKTLFDVCLRGSDREVACNSLLLAEESQFFTAKFSNPDFAGPTRLVELQDVDGDTLETVVAALLTATIKLDSANIERILHCADMLQLTAVKEACCHYMREILDEKQAASTLSLAAKYACDDLLAFTSSYIAANFHTMWPCALQECSRAVFADLIGRDDLSIYSELQVLTAIGSWCEANAAQDVFAELFPAVRLEHMQLHELHVMLQHASVAVTPAAQEALHATLDAAASSEPPPKKSDDRKQRHLREDPSTEACSREATYDARGASRSRVFPPRGPVYYPPIGHGQDALNADLLAAIRAGNAGAAQAELPEDPNDPLARVRARRFYLARRNAGQPPPPMPHLHR